MESRLATWEKIFDEQAEHEEVLRFRNPSFSFWYNWMIAAIVIALFVSFAIWGIDIRTRNAHDAGVREVYDAIDAEAEQKMLAAEEEAKLKEQAEADLQIAEAKALARAIFGIRNFIEKYHYTTEDILTYARCITNRAEATGKSIEEVLAEKNQFIAYSEHNDIVKEYYDLMLQFVADWHSGNLPPCDIKFQNAVLKDTGIWLVDNINASVPNRWHA